MNCYQGKGKNRKIVRKSHVARYLVLAYLQVAEIHIISFDPDLPSPFSLAVYLSVGIYELSNPPHVDDS